MTLHGLLRGCALAGAIALATGLPAAAAEPDTLVVSQSSDTLTLDPSKDTSPISLNLFKNIFEQLTDIAADGSVAPLLATEWSSNEDATVWDFALQEGVTFQDGTPMTAEDVVWSFQKIIDDETSPVRAYLRSVVSVEVTETGGVRFTLDAPFAPWPRQVSLVSILPQAYYTADPDRFATQPIGTGPYRAVEWVKDDRIVLEAYDGHHGGAPEIGTLIFRPVPSETSRTAALLSGELDVVPLLPPAFIDRLSGNPDVKVEKVESNRVLYLGFDTTAAPLDNVKLRQAIDIAIDRSAITEKLLRGLGTPNGQLVAPVTFGYDDGIEPVRYDPEAAKALVAESGYDGTPILFQYPNNRYAFGQEVAQAIAGFLTQAGINVDMQGMEYSAFFPLWVNRQLNGMHLFAFGPSIMDADLPLRSLLETGPSRGYWDNEEVVSLIHAQRASADPAERQELISKVWALVSENVPYSPLYTEIQAYGLSARTGWEPRPDERLIFGGATLLEAGQ